MGIQRGGGPVAGLKGGGRGARDDATPPLLSHMGTTVSIPPPQAVTYSFSSSSD